QQRQRLTQKVSQRQKRKQHPKLKAENLGLDLKVAFKLVAEAWAKSTENPKNKNQSQKQE
ncbi:15415_t:CDS:2, partial [Gigaspora rosea]